MQDRESFVGPRMPAEVVKLDAATYVPKPDKIAAALAGLVSEKWKGPGWRAQGGGGATYQLRPF